MNSLTDSPLRKAIKKRSIGRKLNITYESLEYCLAYLQDKPLSKISKLSALFIGVGQGHEALLALKNDLFYVVTGLDPFIEEDGNGEQDYHDLLDLIEAENLFDRFKVFKMDFDAFYDSFKETMQSYDVIIMNDVLHHIFCTEDKIQESNLHRACVDFFLRLSKFCHNDTKIIISDVEKTGMRPFLCKLEVVKSHINYNTKQNYKNWLSCALKAGYRLDACKVYVPYKLRRYSFLLDNFFGLKTLCNKYYLYLKFKP